MTPQAAAKELEEVMKRVREAQSFISAAIEPGKAIVLLHRSHFKIRESQNWKEFQKLSWLVPSFYKKTETSERVSDLLVSKVKELLSPNVFSLDTEF